jgi:hypothetical protein
MVLFLVLLVAMALADTTVSESGPETNDLGGGIRGDT